MGLNHYSFTLISKLLLFDNQGFWLTGWLHKKNLLQTINNTRKIQSLLGKELGTTIHKQFPPEQITEAIKTYQDNMSLGKILIRF